MSKNVICDWEKKGNLVRFYYCSEDKYEQVWGDDWDDAPYEHNAGPVYDKYYDGVIDICFAFHVEVLEAQDDWTYGGNSPYSKEGFKDRLAPIIIAVIPKENERWAEDDYHQLIGADNSNRILKFYMGDDIHMIPFIGRKAMNWWNQIAKEDIISYVV